MPCVECGDEDCAERPITVCFDGEEVFSLTYEYCAPCEARIRKLFPLMVSSFSALAQARKDVA